jgi:hypothetical protein
MMELRLIIPAEAEGPCTETLNGTLWRVSEPLDISKSDRTKYNCVSYVWGSGRMKNGGLFQIGPRLMSDQTKPALEAAILANEAAIRKSREPPVRAFWIDAVCVPESDGPKRQGTLERYVEIPFHNLIMCCETLTPPESMGFIYSAAASVIVVLQEPTWEVVKTACAKNSPDALSKSQMEILNQDQWIESVWTYQELVNNGTILFTSMQTKDKDSFVPASQFWNCIGFSLNQWKKNNRHEVDSVGTFVNLGALEDTMIDWQIAGYTERIALSVLSNMAPRRYDPAHPQNRLLATLGAITKDVSWGTPSDTIPKLVEKVMQTCEKKNDYSFIYTADERDDNPGLRWRPKPEQPKPEDSKVEEPRFEKSRGEELQAEQGFAEVSPTKASQTQRSKHSLRPAHLRPILAWHCWGNPFGSTQQAHSTQQGFWLDNMIPLRPSAAISEAAREKLVKWLSAFSGWREDGAIPLPAGLFSAFAQLGFSGSDEPHLCESGLFFSQKPLSGKEDVKLFTAASIGWAFGAPGLARWKDGNMIKYSAGVFAGVLGDVEKERAGPLLML